MPMLTVFFLYLQDSRSHQWHHVDNKVARDKVGNALREAVKQREESTRGIPDATHSNNETRPPNMTLSWIENNCNSNNNSSTLEGKIDSPLKKYQTNNGVVSNIHLSRNMYGTAEEYTLSIQPSTLIKEEQGNGFAAVSVSPNQVFSSQQEHSMRGCLIKESHQICPTIHPSCFEMDCSEMMTDDDHHANPLSYPLFPLEELAQSMNIDDLTADLEPRPIENMLLR